VLLAALLLVPLIWLIQRVGDAGFGASAGGFAALGFVASFTTVRAVWGGGPEVAMTLLTLVLWTWTPALHGIGGYLACGSVYGLLPLLHPAGWLFAGLAFVARSHRYSRMGRVWVALTALAVAAPWYLRWWAMTGMPLGFLQAQAELAKSIRDPGGLGPYLGLDPVPSAQVLREDPLAVLWMVVHRLKERLLHIDAWIGWPFLALALWGARRDLRLALRDGTAVGLGVLAVAWVSDEPRLLLPLLPVVAIWSGAGYVDFAVRWPRAPWFVVAAAASSLAWIAPWNTLRPGEELRGMPRTWRDPASSYIELVGAAGEPGSPMFTDSAVLAWRARRAAVFVPASPEVVDRLRAHPRLANADVIVLGQGRRSRWAPSPTWDARLRSAQVLADAPDGPWIGRVGHGSAAEQSGIRTTPVGPGHALGPEDAPASLVEVPQPPATREGLMLHPMTLDALQAMLASARAAGLELRVVSAYRSYEYQARLYAQAVEKHGPDQAWVARPGESEHQLGTTVDLADGRLEHVLEQSFGTTPEGRWVAQHAQDFGFVVTYTDSSVARTGILPEPWHVRYLGDPLPTEAP